MLNNTTRGIHIWHNSKKVEIHRHSLLSGRKTNKVIQEIEQIDYQTNLHSWVGYLIAIVRKPLKGKKPSDTIKEKLYYQVWQTFRHHEKVDYEKINVDGQLLLEFPLYKPQQGENSNE